MQKCVYCLVENRTKGGKTHTKTLKLLSEIGGGGGALFEVCLKQSPNNLCNSDFNICNLFVQWFEI